MTYEEAREFIDASASYGSRPGLAAITELLRRMGDPQEKLSLIHVAGTNGKGSTTAFLASILSAEGYLVGRYISPSVFSYREKIQIGTEYITKEGVAGAIGIIKPICEDMVRDGLDHPTAFEIETAMAFVYLAEQKVDIAIIEAGLGGRLDATNVIGRPLLCIITSISMDHMQYLGDSLARIAAEKAGIIKSQAPVITANTNTDVIDALKQACKDKNTELIEIKEQITDIRLSQERTVFLFNGQEYEVGLLGEYQAENASLAIRAAKALQGIGYSISDNSIRRGLLFARWNGRLEVVARDPLFILDGAHNEDAAKKLADTLSTLFSEKRKIFIMGVLADKDYRRILELTAPLAGVLITVTPNNSRALDSAELAREARNYTEAEVIDAKSMASGVRCAYEQAGKEDIILAFGSLSYLKDIRVCLSN